MLDAALPRPMPPRPPMPTAVRNQVESFFALRRNPLELWGEPAYRLPMVRGRFLGRDQILINAPDAIRHVLVTNTANYRRTVPTRRVLAPILGDGLFLAEGEAWRHQRRTIAPSLAPRTLPMLADHVVRVTEAEEAALAARCHRPLELLPVLQRLALEVAGRSMFSLGTENFAAALRGHLLDYGMHMALPGLSDMLAGAGWRLPIDPLGARRDSFRRGWLAFLDQVMSAREALPADPDRPRDLYDLLQAARDPETGQGFSHAQLRDEVSTMILAGHETTAVALFWAIYLACLYPEQQDRIAAESAAADLSPARAFDALPLLAATRAHLDETLRLYPPAFLIVREAIGADTLLGEAVPQGAIVLISPWVLHRHRDLWTAPDDFDPDRFAPGAPPPERLTYLPFGAGPRICVGAQFAQTEAVLVLARLLRRFRIAFIGNAAVVPRGVVTTQPDRPVRFILSPRATH